MKSTEWIGLASSALLVATLFLPWFGLSDVPQRDIQSAWVCGAGTFECSAWETYSLVRWLLVAAALAPVFLAYFVAANETGSYPTGEFTMTIGFVVIVVIMLNGAIVQPGNGIMFGLSLEWGYFVAMVAGALMAVAGALRSLESGGGGPRRRPSDF